MPIYRILSGTYYEVEAVTEMHAHYEFSKFIDGKPNQVREIEAGTEYTRVQDDSDIEQAMDDFDKSLADEQE